MGPYLPGVRSVYMRQEKSGCESIADAENLRYPSLQLNNIQTLRIGELYPDLYSSDKEMEYDFLDTPIDGTGVLAAGKN